MKTEGMSELRRHDGLSIHTIPLLRTGFFAFVELQAAHCPNSALLQPPSEILDGVQDVISLGEPWYLTHIISFVLLHE